MGFGTGLLFLLAFGLVVLGPKRLHTVLGHVARAKAELDKASRGLKSQLAAGLEPTPQGTKDDEPLRLRAGSEAEPDQPGSLPSEPTADSATLKL